MALSNHARRALKFALRDDATGNEVADVIDAGSGTLTDAARRRLISAFTNRAAATDFADSVDAGTALTSGIQGRLGFVVCDRGVAQEIADELAS